MNEQHKGSSGVNATYRVGLVLFLVFIVGLQFSFRVPLSIRAPAPVVSQTSHELQGINARIVAQEEKLERIIALINVQKEEQSRIKAYKEESARVNTQLEDQTLIEAHEETHAHTNNEDFCKGHDVTYKRQIHLDLRPFQQSKISEDTLIQTYHKFRGQTRKSAVLIHIRNNHFYKSAFSDVPENGGAKTARWEGMVATLQTYSCNLTFPDVDFVINLEDGIGHNPDQDLPRGLPIFTFQKKRSQTGILHPYVTHMDNYIPSMLDARAKYPWKSKRPQLFWRGSTTGGKYGLSSWRSLPRSRLISTCSTLNETCDVGFYHYTQMPDQEREEVIKQIEAAFGTLKKSMPIMDQMQYKFLASLDGNGPCSGRIEKFLFGNSVIFKTESDRIEFYYEGLRPDKHYIPIKSDLTDLPEKLSFALQNDEKMESIASSMFHFAAKNLNYHSIACHMHNLFEEYSKLLNYTLKSVPEMGQELYLLYPNTQMAAKGNCINPIYAGREVREKLRTTPPNKPDHRMVMKKVTEITGELFHHEFE